MPAPATTEEVPVSAPAPEATVPVVETPPVADTPAPVEEMVPVYTGEYVHETRQPWEAIETSDAFKTGSLAERQIMLNNWVTRASSIAQNVNAPDTKDYLSQLNDFHQWKLEEIDANTPPDAAAIAKNAWGAGFQAFVDTAAVGVLKDVSVLSAAVYHGLTDGDVDARKGAFYKVGARIEDWSKEFAPTDPRLQDSFLWTTLPSAVGSIAGFILAAPVVEENIARGILRTPRLFASDAARAVDLATAASDISKGVRTTPFLEKNLGFGVSALHGAALQGGSTYANAITQLGLDGTVDAPDQEDAMRAALLAMPIGASYALPVNRLFQTVDKIGAGLPLKALREHGINGFAMSLQQMAAVGLDNQVAQVTYDVHRGDWDNVLSSGAAGFLPGTAFSYLISAAQARGRRIKSDAAEHGTEMSDADVQKAVADSFEGKLPAMVTVARGEMAPVAKAADLVINKDGSVTDTSTGEEFAPAGTVEASARPAADAAPTPPPTKVNQVSAREEVAVPETPAEPYVTVLDEIRDSGARTIGEIQALFPKAKLSREQARGFRNAAWGMSVEQLSKAGPATLAAEARTMGVAKPEMLGTETLRKVLTDVRRQDEAPSPRQMLDAWKTLGASDEQAARLAEAEASGNADALQKVWTEVFEPAPVVEEVPPAAVVEPVVEEVVSPAAKPATKPVVTPEPAPTPEPVRVEEPAKATPAREAVAEIADVAAEPETTTFIDPTAVKIEDVPVAEIQLSKDVPNFKGDADPETGVVTGQELQGKFEKLGTAPIVVWRRNNGDLEVITGRHRLDLAKRSGEQTIAAQVVDEAKGFTKDKALTFDAEANIRDGQGSVEDYAHYFRHSPELTEETAGARGLLSRAKGTAGWDLGRNASDDLYALWKSGKINDAQALAITRAAPGNPEAQRIGAKYAVEGKPADFLGNVVKAAMVETGGRAQTLDLFGADDSAMRTMEEQAQRAADVQRDLRQQIQAVSGAAKRPEVAKKLGVDVNDPEAVRAKLDQLRGDLARWENWPVHPDLVAQVKGTIAAEIPVATRTETPPPAGGLSEGPGAASAAEDVFVGGTSLKNAVAEIERRQLGLPPATPAETKAMAVEWAKSERAMANEPLAGQRIVEELVRNPARAVNDAESALLLRHKVALENEMNNSAEAMHTAKTPEEKADAAARFDRSSGQLHELLDVVRVAGTVWGRAGVWRQMIAAEDFSLSRMTQSAEAANDGKPLNREQQREVVQHHERIRKAQEEVDRLRNHQSEQGVVDFIDNAAKKKAAPDKDLLDAALGRLKEKADDPEANLVLDIQAIARHFVGEGIRERTALVEAVHGVIKDILPDWTPRMTRDAISGYGRFKPLSKDDVSVALRDLKGQMQQISKLEDMLEKGEAPKKTGIERRTPSDEERRLIKQVEQVKRELNIQPTDPAKQLKSALDAVKTRLRNSLADLLHRFETGEKPEKRPGLKLDEQAQRLKDLRDRVKETVEAIEGKPEISDERRVKMATDAVERSIAEYERRIKDGDLTAQRGNKQVDTPELTALREKRDALRAELDAMKKAAFPGLTPEQRALEVIKKRTETSIKEYERRLREKDFVKAERTETPLDREATDLKFKLEQAKQSFNQGLVEFRMANRTPVQKILGTGQETLNFVRALMTSFDMSAILRQGGFVAFGRPTLAIKAAAAAFRAVASEKGRFKVEQEIKSRANYPLYKKAGLFLSDHAQTLMQMEEQYMSRWASHVPGITHSARGYTTFLNRLRADLFDVLTQTLTANGRATTEEAKAVAHFVNVATGRGNFGTTPQAAAALNTAFFAPRYVASRFQLLAGSPMYGGTAKTRMLIAKEYGRFLLGVGAIYAVGQMAGGTIEKDPRSSEFGKLKFGTTTVDPLTGISQITAFGTRMATGETKTRKGKIVPIRGEDVPYGGRDAKDIIADFFRSKLSPSVGAMVNLATGKDYKGEQTTPADVALDMVTPITPQEIYQAMKQEGLPRSAILSILAFFGMGLTTYTDDKTTTP